MTNKVKKTYRCGAEEGITTKGLGVTEEFTGAEFGEPDVTEGKFPGRETG